MIGKYNTQEKKNLLIFNIVSFSCLILLYFLRNTSYVRPITLSFLMVLLFVSIIFFGYRKDRNNSIKIKNFLEVSIILLIYLTIIYSLGMKVNFVKHIYNLAKLEESIYLFASLIVIELLRYNIYSKNTNDKEEHLINILFFSLLEILVVNNYCFLENIITESNKFPSCYFPNNKIFLE